MTVERIGFMRWEWEVRGVLRRAKECGGIMVLPTGHETLVGSGTAWTRASAERRARRAHTYWCGERYREAVPAA